MPPAPPLPPAAAGAGAAAGATRRASGSVPHEITGRAALEIVEVRDVRRKGAVGPGRAHRVGARGQPAEAVGAGAGRLLRRRRGTGQGHRHVASPPPDEFVTRPEMTMLPFTAPWIVVTSPSGGGAPHPTDAAARSRDSIVHCDRVIRVLLHGTESRLIVPGAPSQLACRQTPLEWRGESEGSASQSGLPLHTRRSSGRPDHGLRPRQGELVTLSMTTPWLGTDDAVYEPVNDPRSVWLQRSRTVAAPVGMPSALH